MPEFCCHLHIVVIDELQVEMFERFAFWEDYLDRGIHDRWIWVVRILSHQNRELPPLDELLDQGSCSSK